MKKVYTLLLNIFLFGQLLSGQDHIHWSSAGDPENGLTITWHSTGKSDLIKWGYTTSYEKGTFAGIWRDDYSGYLYDYTFPAVNASSVIHYSIFSNNSWTTDKTFQTSVDPTLTQFSFIAGGDSRTNMGDWQTAANKLAAESADFYLFLGDNVNSGSLTTDWDDWYSSGANFLGKKLIYYTSGNHEFGSIYLNQFSLPGNEKWYSFEFGNVLFICLFSEQDFSAQHAWLINELSTTTKKWKIVFFHRPFFATDSQANGMDGYRSTWWKAFDDYGVDVILNGHAHYYLRAKPINLNISTYSGVNEYGSESWQGRLQIVAGSLGAPLYPIGSDWYIEKNVSTMNYTKFVMSDNILNMKAYDISGTLLDNVTINKQLTTGIPDLETKTSGGFILYQNYPNPFNTTTTIKYKLTAPGIITLKILDLSGQVKETLALGFKSAGENQITWQPKGLQSGMYFYRLEIVNPSAGSDQRFSETKKLILLK